jgi:hypothetical protein
MVKPRVDRLIEQRMPVGAVDGGEIGANGISIGCHCRLGVAVGVQVEQVG